MHRSLLVRSFRSCDMIHHKQEVHFQLYLFFSPDNPNTGPFNQNYQCIVIHDPD